MIDLPHKQIFSVLFAAGEPVETARVAQAIGADEETVLRYLPALQGSLDQAGIPLQILRLGDRLQLSTLEAFAPVIQDALALRRNIPLSQAALEVLAVAAYNQPVTRALIEQVRGVDSSGVVNSLIEKQLLEEAGRLELPGRPLSYRTTPHFLRTFGLESLEQLPPLPGTEDGTA
jgi:segregation and condensation protein B